jgi:ribonuclease E
VSADVAAVKNEIDETEAPAEAPANALADTPSPALSSVTDQIDLLGQAANSVNATEEPSEVAATVDAQSSAEITEAVSPDPTLQPVEAAPEPQAIPGDIAEVKSEEVAAEAAQPMQEIDRSGVTPAGRAVNDPRVAPRPIGEVDVETLRQALFLEQEAPPVSIVSRDIPRASNDPRGPKPGLSFTAPKSSLEASAKDDLLPDAQAN